jgi:hypothetical protein
MARAIGAGQFRAVQSDRANPHKHLAGLGPGLRHLADFERLFADDGCFHAILPLLA